MREWVHLDSAMPGTKGLASMDWDGTGLRFTSEPAWLEAALESSGAVLPLPWPFAREATPARQTPSSQLTHSTSSECVPHVKRKASHAGIFRKQS